MADVPSQVKQEFRRRPDVFAMNSGSTFVRGRFWLVFKPRQGVI